MSGTLVVARVQRVLETGGELGDGGAVAEAYAEAVGQVNLRLERVHAAIDAKQVSDAVRLMEEPPRLLDEVSALDIPQGAKWEALCRDRGWPVAPPIDRRLLERVLVLSENSAVVEPIQRMYRKAVRTKDHRLAVQSLRRLCAVEHTQDWKQDLLQHERALQSEEVAAFQAALRSGNVTEADRLAQAFVEEPWSDGVGVAGAEALRTHVAEIAERKRQQEGAENLGLLKQLREGAWNRALADRMVQAMDALVAQGFGLTPEAQELLEACRGRVQMEQEAEAAAQRWQAASEALHSAVQREAVSEIRDALAAAAFLDREPEAGLLDQALRVLQHDEARRRRKMMQIVCCVLLALGGALGLSGWLMKRKFFNDRCDQVAEQLAQIKSGERAIARLERVLSKLRTDEPEVYADGRVSLYEETLKGLMAQELARTNEVAQLVAQLQGFEAAQWEAGESAVQQCLERLEALIKQEDTAYREAYLRGKFAWSDHQEAQRQAAREAAEAAQKALCAQAEALCEGLVATWASAADEDTLAYCRAEIARWRELHQAAMPTLAGEVNVAEQRLNSAWRQQENYRAAVEKLRAARSVAELLEARQTLRSFYGQFDAVSAMGDLALTIPEADAVQQRASAEQRAYAAKVQANVDLAKFRAFLSENVQGLKNYPSYYALYGVAYGLEPYALLCKGKPRTRKPSYAKNWEVEGELCNLKSVQMVANFTASPPLQPKVVLLPASVEVRELCELADRASLTPTQLEEHLLKCIEGHLKAASDERFLEVEERNIRTRFYDQARYPAVRRLQLLYTYLSWLNDELQMMPKTATVRRAFNLQRMEALVQPVHLDEVPDEFSWACFSDERVRKRNGECAQFLAQLAKQEPVQSYRQDAEVLAAFRRVARWEVKFAGQVGFKAERARLKGNTLPELCDGEQPSSPLYVLRKEAGHLRLLRAFAPNPKSGGWFVSSEAGKTVQPGEPLFRLYDGTRAIDPVQEIRALRQKLTGPSVEELIRQIPLLGREEA